MKVKIQGEARDFRTVWMEKGIVRLINQPLIPHRFEIFDCRDYQETVRAIKTMVVRGAPAIGATGAYGLAQAVLQFEGDFSAFPDFLKKAEQTLKETRPTAYDLFYAIDKVKAQVLKAQTLEQARDFAVKASQDYANQSAEQCKKIGEFGGELIKDGFGVLTHCNAGALACVDFGTALAPMRFAHQQGKDFFVFADETRPRCQGSRLTAWELSQEGIKHAVIADNAAGHYMQKGEIDLVITGADRVAANGDAANKIGTYEKAVLAKENGIPFYIAVPSSTLDFTCPSGNEIPIEERGEEEVSHMFGLKDNGETGRVRIAPKESLVKNPAFDVTPARFITAFITEKGIFKPEDLGELREILAKQKD